MIKVTVIFANVSLRMVSSVERKENNKTTYHLFLKHHLQE